MVGIDPAATHYTAGVALAVDPSTKMRHIVDVQNVKNLTGDGGDRHAGLIQFIVNMCATYRAQAVCIETNNLQTLLTTSLTLRQQLAGLGVRLMTHQSGRGENDDLAVAQLSALFTNNLITLPGAGNSRAKMAEFVRQFATWHPADKGLAETS